MTVPRAITRKISLPRRRPGDLTEDEIIEQAEALAQAAHDRRLDDLVRQFRGEDPDTATADSCPDEALLPK